MLEFLGSFGQPTYYLRIVKTIWVDRWTEIVNVCCFQNIAYSEWLGVCVENELLMHVI